MTERLLSKVQGTSKSFVSEILTGIESRYRNKLDTSLEGAFVITTTGRYLAVSSSLARLSGYFSSEDMLKAVVGIDRQYASVDRWQEISSRLATSGNIDGLESEIFTHDGSIRWVVESFHSVLGEQGQLQYYEGIRRDITDRKQAESLLAQRDRYLSAIAKVQHILLTDEHGYCSSEVIKLLGEAAQASRCYIFINEQDQDSRTYGRQTAEWCAPGIAKTFDDPFWQRFYYDLVTPALWQNLSQGKPYMELVKNLADLDRQLLYSYQVQAYLILPLMSQGKCWGFVGFVNCVEPVLWNQPEIDLLTSAAFAISLAKERFEQKQAHLEAAIALQKSETRLRSTLATKEALIQAIPDMMFRINRHGVHVDFFPAVGLSPIMPPDEFLGRSLFEVLPEKIADDLVQSIQQCLDTQRLQTCRYSLFIEEVLRFYEARIVPYSESEVLSIVRELQVPDAQHSLQFPSLVSTATRRLSQNFGRLNAHFNQVETDLCGLLELVDLYQQDCLNQDEIEEALRIINPGDISESLTDLLNAKQFACNDVQATLRFLNTCTESEKEELGRIDLHDCIDAVLMLLRDRLNRQYGDFKIYISKAYGKLPEIECYPKQLTQAFLQILTNAIEAVADPMRSTPPVIILSGEATPDRVRLSIADNGNGVNLQEQTQMFQPFVSTKSTHSGLGLALSHQIIVNRHRGALYFAPAAGGGSQIVIELPRCHTSD
ncbi:MAG: PAS domain S-box protein [Plectolyngbya sp. WJT66-NPBG17]|nr:PAS domain S-box protein [Plectolyngbya sp. WJT66-NPBG17]